MILTHRIRLVPNKKQQEYFYKAAGVARFAYNWALAEWERLYSLGESPSEALLRRKLNAIKDEQFPWMRDVTKNAPQQAIKNLGRAYAAFFARTARRPRFKRKGVHDSFRADNGPSPCDGRVHAARMIDKRLKLPRVGWVKVREALRFDGQILSVTILRQVDRWYAIIAVRMPDTAATLNEGPIAACDLGLTTFATIFDGGSCRKVLAPLPLRRFLRRIRRYNQNVARKQKGSRNREKAKTKLARLYARIADIRHDALNKLTTDLARSYRTIAIEDLNVGAMHRNRRTALSIADAGLGEFRRQLRYKGAMHGTRIIVVDRWFPSSKRCSRCGIVNPRVFWGVRNWKCSNCDALHDRDENAARNLYFAASSAVNACGAEALTGHS